MQCIFELYGDLFLNYTRIGFLSKEMFKSCCLIVIHNNNSLRNKIFSWSNMRSLRKVYWILKSIASLTNITCSASDDYYSLGNQIFHWMNIRSLRKGYSCRKLMDSLPNITRLAAKTKLVRTRKGILS